MPVKAPKPCGEPGCPKTTSKRYCPEHQEQAWRRQSRARAEDPVRRSIDIQYGTTRWKRTRLLFLTLHPLCAECERRGIVAAACIVDHVKPTADGGSMWDEDNLQSLCDPCHRAKSVVETMLRRGG
jgi:5-methylcytosine-specific restriction protein A